MKNIIELQNLLNQIHAPLLIQVSRYHSGKILVFLSFNVNDSITISSHKANCILHERLYSTLVQFDIKVENFKNILINIQALLYKFRDNDFKILHQYILAKDINQFYYQVPRQNNVWSDNFFIDIASAFFNAQAVSWLPFNLNSET